MGASYQSLQQVIPLRSWIQGPASPRVFRQTALDRIEDTGRYQRLMYSGQQLPLVFHLPGVEGIVQDAPYRCHGKQPGTG